MAWRGKRLLYNLPKPAIIECEVKKKANIRGQLCCHVSVGSYTIMKGDMPMIHACHACACGKKASAATYAAVRASTEITTWADLVIPILQAITCHMSLPGLHACTALSHGYSSLQLTQLPGAWYDQGGIVRASSTANLFLACARFYYGSSFETGACCTSLGTCVCWSHVMHGHSCCSLVPSSAIRSHRWE